MTRCLLFLGIVIAVAAAAASDRTAFVAVVGGTGAVDGNSDPAEDPFPIRRVFVPTAQLAGRVAVAGKGPFVRLPRDTFEANVRAAARAATDPPPHLVTAAYSAAFADGQFSGTGTWTVAYPARRPGAVPLDPLRVAIANATWAGGSAAVVYRPATGPPALWADPANGSTVRFDWSARPVEEPGERRYDLRLPVAAVATLDLTLPATHTVSVPRSDALLTGPFPGPTAAERLWRLAFGGQARLELTIRTGAAAGRPTPLVRTNLDATFDVSPGYTDAVYAFDLEPVRGTAEEWDFLTDPRLRVVSVTIPAGGTWDVTPLREGTTPGRLRVRPSDPEAAGRLTVRAVAPTPTDGTPWPLPTVRPARGLPGDETAVVRVHPDLTFDGLDPGDFRVTDTVVTPDRHYSVTLTGTLAPRSGPFTRTVPAVRVRSVEPAFVSVETLIWSVRPERSTLTGMIGITPVRGPVDRVSIRLPDGFKSLSVASTPDDPAAGWTSADADTNTWVWEPTRPLTTGKTTTLRLVLLGPSAVPGTPLLFPRIEVPAAAARTGTFQIESESGTEVTSSPPIGPGGRAYQGLSPAGLIVIRPRAKAGATEVITRKDTSPTLPQPVVTTPDGVRLAYSSAEARIDPAGVTFTLKGFVERTRSRAVPLLVQDGFEVVAVRVADRWVDRSEWKREGFSLPMAAGEEPFVPFELHLHRPSPIRWDDWTVWKYPHDLPEIRWTTSPEYLLLPDLSRSRTTPDRVWTMPTSIVTAVGVAFALLVFGFVVRYGSGKHGRVGAFALLLLLGGALVFLSPGWGLVFGPPFAVTVIAAVVILIRVLPAGRRTAAAVVALATVPVVAQAPDPVTVFVTREDSGDLVVHAPQPLLDRLDGLAAGPLPAAVITAADYTAVENPDGVTVTASYTVHVARPNPQPMLFPFTGIRLNGMTLDGSAAFPAARADGYAVAVPAQGRHAVVATFTVPPARPGPDREISFGVPDVPQSRLTFTGLPTSRQPTAPARRGSQAVSTGNPGPKLTADLGAGKSVAVRWRAGPRGPRPGLIVREAGVWDLSPTEFTLTAAFFVRSEQGGLNQLGIEVPAGLEPGRATVRTVDATGTVSAPAGVRDWTLGPETNGTRLLNLVFAGPIEGQAVVTLKFVPPAVPSVRPVLSFPRVARATDVETVYGLRYHGLTAEAVGRTGTVDLPTDGALQAFRVVPELQLDQKPVAAAVRPAGPSPVSLIPTLRAAEPTTLTQSVEWTVGPRADAVGTVSWSAGTTVPAVVPVELPPELPPTDFGGANLFARTRSGSRAEMWLKKPAKTGSLTWRASRTALPDGFELPVVSPPGGASRFVVRPAAGWSIAIPSVPGIAVAPADANGITVTTGPGVRSVRVRVTPPNFETN